MARSADTASSLERLDGVYAEFDKAASAFQAVVWAERAAARDEGLAEGSVEVKRLAGEVAARDVRIRELDSQLGEVQASLEERSKEAQRLGGELDARDRRVRELDSELEKVRASLEDRSTELEELRASQKESSAESDRLGRELAARDSRVAELGAQVDAVKHELRGREREATGFSGQLHARGTQIRRMSRELSKARNEIAAMEASLSWKLTVPLRFVLRATFRLLTVLYWTVTFQLPQRRENQRQLRIVEASGLFDEDFYLTQNPAVAESGVSPVSHFLGHGAQEGRDPNALFSISYYRSRYSEAAKPGVNPLLHYLESGRSKTHWPNPLFDPQFYLAEYPDVAKTGICPLLHFLANGASEGRDPHPLFDTSFYLETNADVAAGDVNPLDHFLSRGAKEKRSPHPLFDPAYYLAQSQDVAQAGINPLVHFLAHGASEGRRPHPLFDTAYYVRENQDVAKSRINPLVHFVQQGWKQGRKPHPLFDPGYYMDQNPEVAECGINPLVHYMEVGAAENRDPSPFFDAAYYVQNDPDIAAARENPLLDFLSRHPQDYLDHLPVAVSYVTRPAMDRYAAWLRVNEINDSQIYLLKEALAKRNDRLPRISVVMPVYNPTAGMLDLAVESVMRQIYGRWQLCIADDASTDARVRDDLQGWVARDPRIEVVTSPENGGVSRATNAAAGLASGEVLVFLGQDAELTPDALAEVALHYADCPEADLVYSDDDKIDMGGKRFAPQFKPDWSPTLLLSYMYMGHILTVRRSLFERLGGFRVGFEGSQDYDFALRATEQARAIGHIPRVLYHWRVAPESTAKAGDAKPASFEAGRLAVAEAFERRGYEAVIRYPKWAQEARCGILAAEFPNDGPSVAIIIPTRDHVEVLRACIESLRKTTYKNYSVLIVDNDSRDPDALDYLGGLEHKVLRVRNPAIGFSFAYLNNVAAKAVDADYVLLLNDDTEVLAEDWLSQMVGYAQMRQVGAVGAKLIYPDGTIQHAGVVHGYHGGMVGHAFKNLPASASGYLSYVKVAREYSAVTAACLLTPRSLYLDLGGLDEKEFRVTYNDVDYCYRLGERGYLCVYCPSAELIHHEGKSRGFLVSPREVANFRTLYGKYRDPWYNPNLSLDDEHFQIRPVCLPRWLPAGRTIRTVMVSHNLDLEDAPYCQMELAVGLKCLGVIDPIVLSPVDGPLRAEYEKADIEVSVIEHPLEGIQRRVDAEASLVEFGSALRRLGAEVVYVNTLRTFWAIDAADRAGLPSIWNPRESDGWRTCFNFLPFELRPLAYECFAKPYNVVFVSNATKKVWRELNGKHNFVVVHDGLDLGKVESVWSISRERAREGIGVRHQDVVVVLVGTVCESKGQIDLVRAIGALPEHIRSRLQCFIVGDRPGEYSAKLHDERARLPALDQARLTIVRETDEVYNYFRAADIAVCTSRIEGYPRVILEAMAFGLPIVTTPMYGIREQVGRGVNAMFYPPGDDQALAEAISQLMVDEKLRKSLASNATVVLAGLTSYEDMLEGYARVLREAFVSKSPVSSTNGRTSGRSEDTRGECECVSA
jgi:GT2 family glycosyltransferase/predicted  nucleic acid-binding Zn-ribbon protein